MKTLILILILALPMVGSRNFNQTSMKLQSGTTGIANLSTLTICGWYTASLDNYPHRLFDFTSSAKYMFVGQNPRRYTFGIATDGTTRSSQTANTHAQDGRWVFVCGSYTPGDGGPRIYIGYLGNAVTETSYATRTDGTGTNLNDSTDFVIANNSAVTRALGGKAAEVRIYDVVLTANEMTALSQGYPVRLDRLKGCWPIYGIASPEPDRIGSNNMTVTGGPARADHAPVAPAFGWWNN